MDNLREQLELLIKDNEVTLDILLVCANKPVNYNNLNNFSCEELWNAAKSFATARNHSHEAITDTIMTVQDADGFSKNIPELISLSGIEPKQKGLKGAPLYYAREETFQDMLYEQAKDKIQKSVYDVLGIPIEKARQRECQIVQIYLQYLIGILFRNKSTAAIVIDMHEFKHFYDGNYRMEMPSEITKNLIMEVLQLARLGFEYDGKFYPFWFTVRGNVGRKFRKMLSESIAARIRNALV